MELSYPILLSLTAVLILLFYRYLIANYNYWKKRGVPSADGVVPGFGHLWPSCSMQKHFTITIKDIYETHTGSMVGMFAMREPVLLIREADLIKTVLQSEFNSFRHHQTTDSKSDPLLYRNPFVLNDQEWKDSRSKFITIVTAKKLKIFSLVVRDAAAKFVRYMNNQLEGKSYVDLEGKDMFERITIEASVNAILSIEEGSFDEASPRIFHKMMKTVFEPSALQALRSMLFRFFPFLNKFFRVGFVPHWINTKFTSIVEDLMKKRKNDGVERNDLLQNLIEICREKGLPDEAVISDAFSLFIEMFGTSSITMSFLACDLAQYPHIQYKLREEINAVAGNYDGEISYEALNEMTYMDQVLSESMRLHPLGVLQKICSEPTELKGSDGIRCRMKPGDQVIVPNCAIQQDSQYWKNPEEFRPERFDKGSEEFQERHKFAYLAFSEGPRMCPGMRMGVLLIKVLIATIVRNFVIEKSPKLKEPVTLDPGHFMSFIKGGAWIRLKRLPSYQKIFTETSLDHMFLEETPTIT